MGLILGVLIIQEVLDELLPGFEGTIVEYEDFDAEVSFISGHQQKIFEL